MKVFISWPGEKSLAVAKVLHDWLPTVINSVEPWISSEGLRAGLKWNQQLEKELNGTNFGIIVATPRNQRAQWLNFEAGALSKKVGGAESRVAPLLIDFEKATDLVGPLASYQATMPRKKAFMIWSPLSTRRSGMTEEVSISSTADSKCVGLLWSRNWLK